MQFQNLLDQDEDRAVSPVIGVILMVAITVILAAVIGTFVLGLGDQVQDTAPNSQFTFDFDSSEEELEITHDGGDGIDADELVLRGDILAEDGDDFSWGANGVDDDDVVRAGTGVLVDDDDSEAYAWTESEYEDGDTVRVVWRGDGDRSSTLRTWSG